MSDYQELLEQYREELAEQQQVRGKIRAATLNLTEAGPRDVIEVMDKIYSQVQGTAHLPLSDELIRGVIWQLIDQQKLRLTAERKLELIPAK